MTPEVPVLFIYHAESNRLKKILQELNKSPNINLRIYQFYLGSSDFQEEIALTFTRTDFQIVLVHVHEVEQKKILKDLNDRFPAVPVILLLQNSQPDELLELIRTGASDFITPPYNATELVTRIRRIIGYQEQITTPHFRLKETLGLNRYIGKDTVFLEEMEKIPLAAKSDARVFISGETGTGKELFARAVHYLSARSGNPFVPVNCGALPVDLMENELFGHRKGAFTGAHAAEEGLVHEAEGGTLFLDEVDCLTQTAQMKLLRFLQEKEYRRLGSKSLRQADVRIIAATNMDIEETVNSGKLRSDLYYRLNVIPLTLPPLRQRQNDVLLLADYFLKKYAMEFARDSIGFTSGARQKLLVYDWPGNVRELQNIVERAVLFAKQPLIGEEDIILPALNQEAYPEPFNQAKSKVITRFEKNYIHGLLSVHEGNITHAAKAAQKNRRAFWELIRKHSIDVNQFKPERKSA